jgi:hypothetical protein
MHKDELITEIGLRLRRDIGGRRASWRDIVQSGIVERNDPEMSGFVYFSDGKVEPASPHDFTILELLVELRDAMAASDRKAPWRACLIRVNRASGDINFDFEYETAERWRVTFATSASRAEEFRPGNGPKSPRPKKPSSRSRTIQRTKR